MKAIELKKILSEFLQENGTERFVKVISDSIDEAGPHNSESIHTCRENVVKKLTAHNKLNLTER